MSRNFSHFENQNKTIKPHQNCQNIDWLHWKTNTHKMLLFKKLLCDIAATVLHAPLYEEQTYVQKNVVCHFLHKISPKGDF